MIKERDIMGGLMKGLKVIEAFSAERPRLSITEAAEAAGQPLSKDEARERIYGMPFAEWKARFQKEATPEQLAAFASAQRGHD